MCRVELTQVLLAVSTIVIIIIIIVIVVVVVARDIQTAS